MILRVSCLGDKIHKNYEYMTKIFLKMPKRHRLSGASVQTSLDLKAEKRH